MGQVGRGVSEVLGCPGIDREDPIDQADVIHICFPYNDEFEKYVSFYKQATRAEHVVIHSTVPVGTSKKLGAAHSPIRGVHPYLAESIKVFVKYFGGDGAVIVVKDFEEKGVTCKVLRDSDTCELLKLIDTTTYGLNILIEKEAARLCKKYDVPLESVYNDSNLTYNKGYNDLGMPEFSKYNIKHMDGKIGGHCIMQNAELLKDTWLTETLIEKNELYG
jgi:hypothetical protein